VTGSPWDGQERGRRKLNANESRELKYRRSPVVHEFRAQTLTETLGQVESPAVAGERDSVSQTIVNCSATRTTGQMAYDLFPQLRRHIVIDVV
jgi:hypothetical protein